MQGSGGWYWCCDYASEALYEAEQLFRCGNAIQHNRLVFVHYPDGRVVEPIKANAGQYFGGPSFDEGKLQLFMVYFPKSMIYLFQYDDTSEQTSLRAEIPLTEVKDCYNLLKPLYL